MQGREANPGSLTKTVSLEQTNCDWQSYFSAADYYLFSNLQTQLSTNRSLPPIQLSTEVITSIRTKSKLSSNIRVMANQMLKAYPDFRMEKKLVKWMVTSTAWYLNNLKQNWQKLNKTIWGDLASSNF